ncbi:MAG: hypothetical protein GY858_05560 [Candidatus Omnitrophica bacterium]|nr:hypothetical protein [Candidatus Omnitrophota bacterium]
MTDFSQDEITELNKEAGMQKWLDSVAHLSNAKAEAVLQSVIDKKYDNVKEAEAELYPPEPESVADAKPPSYKEVRENARNDGRQEGPACASQLRKNFDEHFAKEREAQAEKEATATPRTKIMGGEALRSALHTHFSPEPIPEESAQATA